MELFCQPVKDTEKKRKGRENYNAESANSPPVTEVEGKINRQNENKEAANFPPVKEPDTVT